MSYAFPTRLIKNPIIHKLPRTFSFLPQVMLVVCQPDRQQRTGTQLHKTLVKLLSHKIEPTDKSS